MSQQPFKDFHQVESRNCLSQRQERDFTQPLLDEEISDSRSAIPLLARIHLTNNEQIAKLKQVEHQMTDVKYSTV